MGFVILNVPKDDPRFGKAQPCSCKQTEHAQRTNERLLRLSQLGALQQNTFDTFVPEGFNLPPQVAANLKRAYNITKRYAESPEGWLLIQGGYGCGKTHLAAAIANHQLEQGRQVIFANTPDLLDHLRAAFGPGAGQSYDERFDQVRNTPLLILDDLGSQSNSEWVQEKLYQVFNYRYTAGLPTVVTTNEPIESVEPRIQSRLSDTSFVQRLLIDAPDFRRGGLYHEQLELSTLDQHYEKQFGRFDFREQELNRTQSANLRRAYEKAINYAESPDGWLVYQSTTYGNGKTFLAASIANYATENGMSVLFVMVPDLLDHLRATFNPSSGARLDKRFAEVKNVPLLILDDLGTESATPWVREKLYQLFNHRYNARKPTVITTATPIEELDERLRSRMLDGSRCEFFVLESPSYRGGVAKKKKTRSKK